MASPFNAEIARENLKRVLEYRRRSSFEVSETIGRNRTYIDDFLKGRKDSISVVVAADLCAALNISTSYILAALKLPDDLSQMSTRSDFDRAQKEWESQFSDDEPERSSDEGVNRTKIFGAVELIQRTGLYPLPLFQTAKYRIYFKSDVSGTWAFPDSLVERELNTLASYLDVAFVEDDAMESPEGGGLRRGDRVVINRLDNNVGREGIFLVTSAGSTIVRQVAPMRGTDPFRVEVRCLNPRYASFETETGSGDFAAVGRVVLHIRKV